MRRFHWICFTTLALAACSPAAFAEPPDAGNESRALAAHIEAEYSAYVEEYVHVFLGYSACAYDFIDEEVLNSLADDVLRAMTTRAVELIRTEHGESPAALTEDAIQYAASLAVLTTMEMWSNGITAEIAPAYAGDEFDCSASIAEDKARYEALKGFETP